MTESDPVAPGGAEQPAAPAALSDPELALERARALADSGARPAAIRSLESLLEGPADLDLRVRAGVALGEALLASGDAESAETVLGEAVALAEDADPESEELGDIAAAEAERARVILDEIR